MDATLRYLTANAAVNAATKELGSQKVIAVEDLERWKALDAEADVAYGEVRRARAKLWEHRATHPPTHPPTPSDTLIGHYQARRRVWGPRDAVSDPT
jgi:hypothetical protein